MMVELWAKNGYKEIKDDSGDVGGNRSISVIWTECSRILSQGANWGTFSSVFDTQGKEFNKFFKIKASCTWSNGYFATAFFLLVLNLKT
jgi:hypothetical protein